MKKPPKHPPQGLDREAQTPPRERILAAARALFGEHGIRAVGVEAIAQAARSNKMTLYRHFASKDELVADYLRCLGEEAEEYLEQILGTKIGDPRAQLDAWIDAMSQGLGMSRGCPLTNAAVELAEKEHPARLVVETHKQAIRDRLVQVCQSTGVQCPELLADELVLLVEGARVTLQSVGPAGPGAQFKRMATALVDSQVRA